MPLRIICIHCCWVKWSIDAVRSSWFIIFSKYITLLIFSFFFFWHCGSCEILGPWPGVKPMTPALEEQSFNHCTTREVPPCSSSVYLFNSLLKVGLMSPAFIFKLSKSLFNSVMFCFMYFGALLLGVYYSCQCMAKTTTNIVK